jgi:SAM-dependent methyltransferase
VSTSLTPKSLTPRELDAARRSRRHPRPTQFDYLHVRRLVGDLRRVFAQLGDTQDVLDVYCGTRPYDDLLPPGARVVGLDVVGNPYGVADVASDEFLPFDDASFDVVTCIEAFQYVQGPDPGIEEIRRVLRPGGRVVLSLPFAWEYDRGFLECRYTEPELRHLFRDWDEVAVVENGGRAIVWTTLTGTMLERMRIRLPRVLRPLFAPLYVGLNGLGAALDALERREASGAVTLPMNLLLTARRPVDG